MLPLEQGGSSGFSSGLIIVFCFYFRPLISFLRKYKLKFHPYDDDCQIYVSIHKGFDPLEKKKTTTDCLADIRLWMSANYLGFNDSKTKVR